MAYSDDLRQKLLHAVDSPTLPQTALARLFDVSLSYLNYVVQRRNQTGNPHCLPHGGGRAPKLSPAQQEALCQHVAEHPAALLQELSSWLETGAQGSHQRLCAVSPTAAFGAAKKKGTWHASERDTPAHAAQREQ